MKRLTLTLTLTLLLAGRAGAQPLNPMTLVATYTGEAPENWFGGTVTMGDFDHDGHAEYIISAGGWNNNTGKNYYYDWNGSWPQAPFWTFQGTGYNVLFDLINRNLGDVTGDGIDDFVIEQAIDSTHSNTRMMLLYGSVQFDSLPDWTLQSTGGHWWGSADSCGDVNGDGHKDFIVQHGAVNPAQFRIYEGGSPPDTIPIWHYTTSAAEYSICHGLGDVNGDGYADVLILSYETSPALLFFGGSPMDTLPGLVFGTTPVGAGGGVGDVNADGYNDLCLNAVTPDSNWGAAVHFGGPDLDTQPDGWLHNRLGSVCAINQSDLISGDFNGDGISDIACRIHDPYWLDAVDIYLGGPNFNTYPDAVVSDYHYTFAFGVALAAGDVDGDGCDELLVGSPEWDWFSRGRAYLYDGPATWIDYGSAVKPEALQRVPGWFTLAQNYPNPFNSTTSIHFELGKKSNVSLAVFNLQGKTVKELITGKEMLPGGFNVSWTGKNEANQPVASGIYLLELKVDQYQQIKKMALLR